MTDAKALVSQELRDYSPRHACHHFSEKLDCASLLPSHRWQVLEKTGFAVTCPVASQGRNRAGGNLLKVGEIGIHTKYLSSYATG